MTSNNVNINNKDQGLVELNDITQKVVINTDKNVENVLDIFNRKSLKKNKKNNDFLEKISNIEDLDVFFQNLSKHHLFIRNTLFSKKDVFFEIIFMTYSFVHTKINEEAFPNAIDLYSQKLMRGRGRGKYMYKDYIREEGEKFLREEMQKYFPHNQIEYVV